MKELIDEAMDVLSQLVTDPIECIDGLDVRTMNDEQMIAYLVGYLRGAAEVNDMTISELVDG